MPLRLLLSVVGGLSLWVSFPGHGLWPAAPLGVALWALAARDVGARRGAALLGAGALAFMMPTLSWSGVYVGAVPWLGLAGISSVYFLLLGALLGGVRVRDRLFPLLVGVGWVSVELARSTVPYGGFPWARLAFSQADAPFGRVASLLGAPGVTFAVAAVGGALAVAVRRVARAGSFGDKVRSVAVPLAVAAAVTVVPLAVRVPTDGPTARFVAIQGDVPQAGLDFNAQRRAVLDAHAAVTRQAARQLREAGAPPPDLVVWPENASDIDPLRRPDAAAVIRDAVSAIDAPVVVGAVLDEPLDHLSNSSLLYEPGRADPTQRYDKRLRGRVRRSGPRRRP